MSRLTCRHNRMRSRSGVTHTGRVRDELTEEIVINEGGWNPRYARVLLIQEFGDEALVLVDGNGDGAEVEREQWLRTPDGWEGGVSGGIGSFDHDPLWTWGWTTGTAYVVGCASPGSSVSVAWLDQVESATANPFGIWVCLFPEQPPPPPAENVPNNSFGIRMLKSFEKALSRTHRPRIVQSDDRS